MATHRGWAVQSPSVGATVVGTAVGAALGLAVGTTVGLAVGIALGRALGDADGASVTKMHPAPETQSPWTKHRRVLSPPAHGHRGEQSGCAAHASHTPLLGAPPLTHNVPSTQSASTVHGPPSALVGDTEGLVVGAGVGLAVGEADGARVGASDGLEDGAALG